MATIGAKNDFNIASPNFAVAVSLCQQHLH
jgi:hypothetical protein